MNVQHKNASDGRWCQFSLIEQMANVGSEIFRALNWKKKGNIEYSNLAFERSLELFDFTITDPKNIHRLREITRTRESWIDYFSGDNEYNSTAEIWQKYFYGFNYAARNTMSSLHG
jgi:hypothetical protein